jgi:dTDP-4-dehydrorhamnose reductase
MRAGPILLFGAAGQLGRALEPRLRNFGPVLALTRAEADLDRPESLRAVVRSASPRLVINAAAYTAVDDAEHDEVRALRVNAESPRVLGEETARLGVPIVHYSTNYVFDGTSTRPYREDDAAAPLGVYGRSKLLGERAIEANPQHLTLRLAGVYAQTGRNFMLRMLDLAREREELRVVDDQLVAPTPASAVAGATVEVLMAGMRGSATMPTGIYHLSCAGSTSWYGFAERILALDPCREQQCVKRLTPVRSSEFPTVAQRPLNGLLDNGKCARELGISLPDWEPALRRTLTEYAQRS